MRTTNKELSSCLWLHDVSSNVVLILWLNFVLALSKEFVINYLCSVLRYLSVTIVTLYPVRHDRYMIVKVHSYVKVVLLIPSIVLWIKLVDSLIKFSWAIAMKGVTWLSLDDTTTCKVGTFELEVWRPLTDLVPFGRHITADDRSHACFKNTALVL